MLLSIQTNHECAKKLLIYYQIQSLVLYPE